MTSPAELGILPDGVKDAFFGPKILTRDPITKTLLLDQDALVREIRRSKSYLEVLGTSEFAQTRDIELIKDYQREFISSAQRIARQFGVRDDFLESIKPDEASLQEACECIVIQVNLFPVNR